MRRLMAPIQVEIRTDDDDEEISNIAGQTKMATGDIVAAFAEADVDRRAHF